MRIFWERRVGGGGFQSLGGSLLLKVTRARMIPAWSHPSPRDGWWGQGEDGHGSHHPLVSLGMSLTGGEDSGGRKKPFPPLECSYSVLDNPGGGYQDIQPVCHRALGCDAPWVDKQQNRGHQVVLGKTEGSRGNTRPDGNRVSPREEDKDKARCAVGQVGKGSATFMGALI